MASQNRFATSFLVGLLALPLAAAGATALVASQNAPLEATVSSSEPTAALTAPPPAVQQVPVAQTTPATEDNSAADLARACGEAGLDLVDRESRGELDALEQAALDSLRSICETEGYPLPGPPAPEPVIRTVTVDQATPTNALTAMSTAGDHDEDDDHDDHDEEDEEDD